MHRIQRPLVLTIGVFLISGIVELTAAGRQLSASFQAPILGYVFDTDHHVIRPIIGIAGNSRIAAPLSLPLTLDMIWFLPDQRHAIASSKDYASPVLLDLDSSSVLPIKDAPPGVTKAEISPEGSAAALYSHANRKIVIVNGLPSTPKVIATIDIAVITDDLKGFSVSDSGSLALLVFSTEGRQDSLYSWTFQTGLQAMQYALPVSSAKVFGDDAVIVDRANSQVVVVRNVAGQASSMVIADAGDGIRNPEVALVSSQHEIYIGDSNGTIAVFDFAGQIIRRTQCGCVITSISPLRNSAIRLTDRIDRPIIVLDGSQSGGVVFIPALTPELPTAP